jgi:hypothetical protein
MRNGSLLALAAAAVSSVLGLAGCGTDLGECDRTMLGGSDDPMMPVPHTAQGLVDASCASGLCHSVEARGEQRRGAPAELNFDVLPADDSFEEISLVQDGAAVVQNRREDMWALIDSGEMPPPRPQGGGEMSAANKEVVRNWLACGAPVIATPPVSEDDDAFSQIYTALSGMNCQGCHQPGLNMGSFLPMPGNPCEAHDMLVGAMASGPDCGDSGMVLVQPGMPDQSLLLHKLKGTQTCGDSMPMGLPALFMTNETLVRLIETWIMDGALEPANCR